MMHAPRTTPRNTSIHRPGLARRLAAPALLAATLFVGACAGMPPPVAQMALSESAIDRAAAAGAGELAPVELSSARDHMQRARSALADKDHARALSLAQAAEVDARLAEASAEASRASRAAGEVTEGTRVLREELKRNTRPQP
jgi:3-hydroxyisobutyrate dehydrogenase-like beta-hydroxyacid dehydrogenase